MPRSHMCNWVYLNRSPATFHIRRRCGCIVCDFVSSEPTRGGSPAEVNNPFHASGELRRKADFIITHSRISRTELHIADPDEDKSTANSSSSSRNDAPDSVDGPVCSSLTTSTVQQQQELEPQYQIRCHDDETTVATVTSSMITPLHVSTAEKITVKKKRCIVQ